MQMVLTVACGCCADVVVFDELLLLADHVFEVNDGSRL